MIKIYIFLIFFLLYFPKSIYAQVEYTVPKEEPQTVYTKRYNWAHPRTQYYATTRHSDEIGRFDTSQPPDGTWTGTATVKFTNVSPGKYELWVYYRRSVNRATSVIWNISTDGVGNKNMSGTVNQHADEGCCGKWFPLVETQATPLDVNSSLTLVFSSDTAPLNGSISYGGAKIIKVSGPQNTPPPPSPTTLPITSVQPSPSPTSVGSKPGDANGDGKIDGLDYVIWLNHYNQQATGASLGDFNNNGKVDGLDYVIWLNNYGK